MPSNGTEKCTVVWQEVSSVDNTLLGVSDINHTGYLPFYLSGNEITKLNNGGVSLEPKHLLFGIFLGLHDLEKRASTNFWIQDTDKKQLLEILSALQKYFEKESLEIMIKDVAYVVGKQNGSAIKNIILNVGLTLVPNSSRIKAELAMNSPAYVNVI